MKKNFAALLAGILIAIAVSVGATTYVTGKMIADGTITAADIANGTITAANMATGSITASKISDGTITADDISEGSITADKLDNESLETAVVEISSARQARGVHVLPSVLTGTTLIPFDDTIPQFTEGDEYLSTTFEPELSGTAIVETTVMLSSSVAGHVTVALFRNSGPDAFAVASVYCAGAGQVQTLHLVGTAVYLGTTPITFTVRAGLSTAGTVTVNGVAGGRLFGGEASSTLVVTQAP